MSTEIGGYEDNLAAKGSGRRNVTNTSLTGDKVGLDTASRITNGTNVAAIDDDGHLQVHDMASGLSIAQGLVTGHTFVHKFGNAPDFDFGDNEVDVWDGSEDNTVWEKFTYNYSSTADIDYITSDDNGDTQDVEIQGLDTNFDLVTQTITLTGQTPSELSTYLVRIFRMKNVNSTDFAGHVFCYVSGNTVSGGVPQTAADIRAIVQPGNNQTEMAMYTIPNGKTGYLRSWYASSSGATRSVDIIIKLKARPTGGVFQLKHRMAWDGAQPYRHPYFEPEVFAAKTDIVMTAQLGAAATEAAVSAGFDIVLVDD